MNIYIIYVGVIDDYTQKVLKLILNKISIPIFNINLEYKGIKQKYLTPFLRITNNNTIYKL